MFIVMTLAVLVLALIVPLSVWDQLDVGEALVDACGKIEKLHKKKNIPGARTEATECLKGLEQELGGNIGQFFLEEVAGWKCTRFRPNTAMAMLNASAQYTKAGSVFEVP